VHLDIDLTAVAPLGPFGHIACDKCP
jgi:hypothetical protein